MSLKPAVLLLFIQCLFGMGASAQVYSNDYDLFTTREGLPHNNILSALQDSYGFLWLATYSGLSVYDGSNFKTYRPFQQQEDNWIYAIETIYEDALGNIWIGTWGGLVSCFVRKEQQFIEYKAKPLQAKIKCFYRAPNGSVWIGYQGGRIGWISKDSVRTVQATGADVLNIAGAGTDSLFLLSAKGVYIYDARSGSVHALPQQENVLIQDIDKSKFPTIAMGTTGFYRWGQQGLRSEAKVSIPQNNRSTVYSKVAQSKNGYYYYTDGFTIYKYDSLNRVVESYAISDNSTFNENNILNVFIEDRFGILWLGTTSGLYKIDQKKHQFQKYSINNKSGYMTHNYVRAVCIDSKNNAWIGFRSGRINKLVRRGNDGKYVYDKFYTIKGNVNSVLIKNYSVNTIFETRDGTVLVGGESGVFKIEGHNLVPFLPEPCNSVVALVWSLYEDKAGNVWMGTNGFGLFMYSRHKRRLYKYVHEKNDTASLPDNKVWKIFEDSRGRIWLGTDKGLVYVNDEAGITDLVFQQFSLPGADDPNVWNIAEDKAGNLWIGTTGNGVYKIALASMQAKHLDKIKAKVISAIIIDSAQNAWISTIGGLYQYDVVKDKVSYYSEDDGLLSNDFNYNAAAITATGSIFLGTKTGLVFYDPQKISHHKTSSSRVILTSLLIEGKEATKKLYSGNAVILPHNENNFSIDFALLDFSPAKPFRYRYRLENYNEDWIYLPDHQNRALYHNVPPGTYYFTVQGSTDGSNWHSQEKGLSIIIKPAFWQMPLFWISILAALIIGVICIIRLRFVQAIQAERAQAQIEKQIAELELKALQAQMNPHFIFNTMNSIQHFILSHNEVEANDYLSRFARLMRLVLESSKNKYIALNAELESLELYLSLEQLRFEGQFDYEINVAADIIPTQVTIPSMLIQPFVENAIKHGLSKKASKGLLRLTFDRECGIPGCIRVVIEDNGVGRGYATKTGNHISRGIQLIEDRIKTYNFIENRKIGIRFVDKIQPEEGTIVQIEIPLGL
jgi:ligand-binding sensor domain-containing protein